MPFLRLKGTGVVKNGSFLERNHLYLITLISIVRMMKNNTKSK